MNKGNLFVISGPSGTGKGTVCEEILKKEKIYLSVSATSRDRRNNETEGVTYNYVTRTQFENMIKNNQMLEWAEYSGNYYGTPKKNVESLLNEGKNVLLEIEPQGALKVKQLMPEAILIFLIPPSMKELKKRLSLRGRETTEQIKERLAAAVWEMRQASKYNEIVVNDNLELCVERIAEIIQRRTEKISEVERLLNEKIEFEEE